MANHICHVNVQIRICFEFPHLPFDNFEEYVPLDQERFLMFIEQLCSSKHDTSFDHNDHFMFGSHKIKEFDTPRTLKMIDGDVVRVIFNAESRVMQTRDLVLYWAQLASMNRKKEITQTPCEQVLLGDKENPDMTNGDKIEIKSERKGKTFNKEIVKKTDVEIAKLERQSETNEKEHEAHHDSSVIDKISEEVVTENREDEDCFVDLIVGLHKSGFNRTINIWIVNQMMIPTTASSQSVTFPRERIEIMVNIEFSKHKQRISDHVGYPAKYLILTIDGKQIQDNETPEDLKMKNNNVIEVIFAVPKNKKTRKMLHKRCLICLTLLGLFHMEHQEHNSFYMHCNVF